MLSILLFVINFWWWEFGLSELARSTSRLFVFVIFYASLFYFLCALLFPDDMKDYAGFQDYFMSRRQWFFGILALINDGRHPRHAAQGPRLFRAFRAANTRSRPSPTSRSAASPWLTTNRLFQVSFVVANLVYEVTWILRHFDTLPNLA